MEAIGNLIKPMAEARNARWPGQLRKRADGTVWFECTRHGCASAAVDPQVYCAAHLSEQQHEQNRALAAAKVHERRQQQQRQGSKRKLDDVV